MNQHLRLASVGILFVFQAACGDDSGGAGGQGGGTTSGGDTTATTAETTATGSTGATTSGAGGEGGGGVGGEGTGGTGGDECVDPEECISCNDFLQGLGAPEELCCDAVPMSDDLYLCSCVEGCAAECGDNICELAPITDACAECMETSCEAELTACTEN